MLEAKHSFFVICLLFFQSIYLFAKNIFIVVCSFFWRGGIHRWDSFIQAGQLRSGITTTSVRSSLTPSKPMEVGFTTPQVNMDPTKAHPLEEAAFKEAPPLG